MIRTGVWLTNGKGVYMVSEIDGEWITLKPVTLDDNGVAYYGKGKLYRIEDLEGFTAA